MGHWAHSNSSILPGRNLWTEYAVPTWTTEDIRIFLQEWESMSMRDVAGNMRAARMMAHRLKTRGLFKTCRQCFLLFQSLQDIYHTFQEINQKPRRQPLPCPFGPALKRILQDRREPDLSGMYVSSLSWKRLRAGRWWRFSLAPALAGGLGALTASSCLSQQLLREERRACSCLKILSPQGNQQVALGDSVLGQDGLAVAELSTNVPFILY